MALYKLQWLMWLKTKPNQTNLSYKVQEQNNQLKIHVMNRPEKYQHSE